MALSSEPLARLLKLKLNKEPEEWPINSNHVIVYSKKKSASLRSRYEIILKDFASYEDCVTHVLHFEIQLTNLSIGEFFVIRSRNTKGINIMKNYMSQKLKPSDEDLIIMTDDKISFTTPNGELLFFDNRGRGVSKTFKLRGNQFVTLEDKEIGRGMSASVMKAVEIKSPHSCFGLKIMELNEKNMNINIEAADHEVKVLRNLNHPNIIKLFDDLETGGERILVLDLMDFDLIHYLTKTDFEKNRMSEKQTKDAASQILQGLKCIHDQEIAHNDLKCDNILVKRISPGNVLYKICDLGSSTADIAPGFKDHTPQYVSPEMLKYVSGETLDGTFSRIKSDMWSFGVIVYNCLIGLFPFDDDEGRLEGRCSFKEDDLNRLSRNAIYFVVQFFKVDSNDRPSAEAALLHPWLCDSSLVDHDYAAKPPLTEFNINQQTLLITKPTVRPRRSVRIALTREKTKQEMPLNELRKVNTSNVRSKRKSRRNSVYNVKKSCAVDKENLKVHTKM